MVAVFVAVVPDTVVDVALVVVVVCAVIAVLVVTVSVTDVVAVCAVVEVIVDVHSSPHMTGQFVLANLPWSPSSSQSEGGIRDPQPAASLVPWHDCGT